MKINGKQQYLRRIVDQDGELVDVYLQARRDGSAAAVALILLIFFRFMVGDYQAAVLSAGFGGFEFGATPTSIANMPAVAKPHGPALLAFIILPLVAAFFVDITNSFVLQAALNFMNS